MTAPIHPRRVVKMKLTTEAVSKLLAEALDLPPDLEIVAMFSPPLEPDKLYCEVEGTVSLAHLDPDVDTVFLEFDIGQEGRTVKARRLRKIVDAQERNRVLASVPDDVAAQIIKDATGKPIAQRVLGIARRPLDS